MKQPFYQGNRPISIKIQSYLQICLLAYFFTCATAQFETGYPVLWESVIYEGNVQNDKSFGYYQMTISERYFSGTQALAIRVVPEQFDSDPDLFISKNNSMPTNSSNSQWFCVKQGGDTCVIARNDIQIGDTFYIGVRCINPCQYTISSSYMTTTRISGTSRTQMRLEGYSSTLLEYLVPSTNANGQTRAVQMKVESENAYNPIDLYFSLDNVIYQVEERKIESILSTGVGFSFTENDFGWCTGCLIYLLVEVINDGRYYMTFTPSPRDTTLTTIQPIEVMVNIRQQECLLYFVREANNDLILFSNGFQGDTDFYVSGSQRPTSHQDTSRILQTAQRVQQKAILITAADRTRWGFRTGVLNLCLYAFDVSSTRISAIESNFGSRIDAQNGVSYTFNIERNNYIYFRYTQSTFTSRGNITVSMTNYGLGNGQPPARLFYRMCPNSDINQCFLSETEAKGQGNEMTELSRGNGNIINGNTRTATFQHFPSNCRRSNQCFYLISVYFPDQNGPMRTSFSASYNVSNYHEIAVTENFKNVIQQGSYFYYAIMPGSSAGFSFLKSLTIKLESIIGDADLVVSVENSAPRIELGDFEARGSDRYDSLSLNKTGNFSLDRPLYIGVYAQTFCVYQLSFEPVYEMEYNQRLTKAVPVLDSIAYNNYFLTEFEESFYSFRPWWAGYENRTLVFFAEVFFNNVFFYMKANDYPLFYSTEYHDVNDVIVLNPGDRDYSIDNSFYVRARPDFSLQDLVSKRQYIFNFFIFTQLQPRVFSDIHLNELKFGYSNRTNVYYRHFIVENNATYNFSLIPIIGNPALLLKLSNDPIYPISADVSSWDYKSDKPDKERESIIVTFSERSSRYAFCDRAGLNLNGGSRSCGFYLAVECQTECIYNITVQIVGREKLALPKYLIEEDYYTGQVKYNQYSYFYYPISKNLTGEMVIILNKTAPLGQNGDSMILATLMPESTSQNVMGWQYPTKESYQIASTNYKSNQPEILEVCSKVLFDRCSENSCILMIGVLGVTENVTSNFRILAQKQNNKLYERNAITGTIQEIGKYHYYWFTSNVSAINPTAFWEYTISTSLRSEGQDVDLFVSAFDGRFPVSEDYDFASENLGADDVYISSNSVFFDEAGYDKANGILFMVGVKALTANAQYTLMMTGPTIQQPDITNLTTAQQQARTIQGTHRTNYIHHYKWFNWGHKDFRINVDVTQGNVSVFVNFVGEENFITNGFQALPLNHNNSKWTVYLAANQEGVLRVTKEDVGGDKLFCYFCWYFITVTTNMTGNSQYRIAVNEVPDVGEEVLTVALNTSYPFTLPATGTVSQRKFILDSKDHFEITATVTTGYLIMYVGLYPNSPLNRFQWKAEGSTNLKVYVKQTDQNFHVGSFYYITMQSGSGRTTFNLQMNQQRTVKQLEGGLVYKDQYWNSEERIKFYYFQIPTPRVQFRTVITVQALTEDFYPTVLLTKNVRTSAPTNFQRQLTYPNLKAFTLAYGDDFFSVSNQNKFTYQYLDQGGDFTYFTMAVYSFSYGMTDKRKAQFKISVFFDNRSLQQSYLDLDYFYNSFEPTVNQDIHAGHREFLKWEEVEFVQEVKEEKEHQETGIMHSVSGIFQEMEVYISKAKKIVTAMKE